MGDTVNKELEYLDWTRKVAERLQVVHTCILDKRKIMDSDYDVMEALYRLYDRGEIPFYHRVVDALPENVSQSDLFTDRIADNA